VEANGRAVNSPEEVTPLFSVHSRVVPFSYIPTGVPLSRVTVSLPDTNRLPADEGNRVGRAKDLHEQVPSCGMLDVYKHS